MNHAETIHDDAFDPCAFDPAAIDFTLFAFLLETRRIRCGKSVRHVAREAAITVDAVRRAADGRNPGAFEFFALAGWMGEQPGLFFRKDAA